MDRLTVSGYRRRPPHVVAEHLGLFAKEGIEVDFHIATLAPEHNREMAEGRWNITLSSADTMIARAVSDCVDYVLFMQAEEGLSAYLIGQKGVTIESLRGKRLAGDPGDSISILSAARSCAITASWTMNMRWRSSAIRRSASKRSSRAASRPPC